MHLGRQCKAIIRKKISCWHQGNVFCPILIMYLFRAVCPKGTACWAGTWVIRMGKESVSPHETADQLCAFCTSRESCEYDSNRKNTHNYYKKKNTLFLQFSFISGLCWQKIWFNFLMSFLVRNVSLSNIIMCTCILTSCEILLG